MKKQTGGTHHDETNHHNGKCLLAGMRTHCAVSYTHLDVYKRQIKNCDRIMYVRDKGISESGSHEELIEKHGDYYHLYTAQIED